MPDAAADSDWMRRALELAERGRGAVEPNPMVGAVVVREGRQIGEGWHERFGGPHAEVHALQMAGEQARGATLYVTLEPCCHFGKTPPCTDAIIASGIRRVVVAMTDPFPQVYGGGLARLHAAGIAIETGVLEADAVELNRSYLTLVRLGRPYVHAKWAMSLDGKIATRTGHSQWISSESSRAEVHRLRGLMDAIIVGIGTVHADDPLLTARPAGPRTPARVVLSRTGELPANCCRLVQSLDEGPVIVAVRPGYARSIPGVEYLEVESLEELLAEFGRRRMTNLWVEGGASVFGSFFDADLVDEMHVFIGPKIIGGSKALSPIGGVGLENVHETRRPIQTIQHSAIGGDLYIRAKLALASSFKKP